jgi:hypothetical protein
VGRPLIDRLTQHASDGRLAVAELSRDRAQAFATLVHQMDGTAVHAS